MNVGSLKDPYMAIAAGSLVIALVGFPALLASAPTRRALIPVAVVGASIGMCGLSILVANLGVDAMGGVTILIVDAVFVIYWLAIIALRAILMKKTVNPNDL